MTTPTAKLDERYSEPGSSTIPWAESERRLADAGTYWISTVRPDGRPHVTPLLGIWRRDGDADGDAAALYFCTGPEERKARNLEDNRHVVLTAGNSALVDGLDLVVEGEAEPVHDEGVLREVADAWVAKYGETWRLDVSGGSFHHPDGSGPVLVFRVRPQVVFGFHKGDAFGQGDYSQTRWEFADPA